MSAKSNIVVPLLHSSTELAYQVEKIVGSEAFAGSETLRKLLLYLSRRSKEARSEPIRVREIATDVFGRSKDFDSQSDSVVRVHTSRLRSKLAEYYMEEGAEDELIISIPKGGYTLACHLKQAHASAIPILEDPVELPVPTSPDNGHPITTLPVVQPVRRILSLPLALALAMSTLVLGWLGSSTFHGSLGRSKVPPALQTFWQDFTAQAESPLVVFSNFRLIGSLNDGLSTYVGADDPNKPIIDTYTTMGEVTGVYEVSRILQQMGKLAMVKRGRLLTWDEAKDQNLIFVGGPLAETPLRDVPGLKEFRFTEKFCPDGHHVGSIVNAHPRQGELPVYFAVDPLDPKADAHRSKIDYAVVALQGALSHDHRMIILAGISEYGTAGAAEFVTREASVKELLAQLHVHYGQVMPPFEALLRFRVEGGVPVDSKIVAIHSAS